MNNFPSCRPVQIFPWQQPFLPALKRLIERDTKGNAGSALIIVPNNRSWRYFYELYKQDNKAQIIPKMLPYSEMLDIWSALAYSEQGVPANQLDLAELAYEAVQEAAKSNADLTKQFASMDIKLFLPWAFRLSALFEDLFQEGLAGKDIPFARDDVPAKAAALLESVGKINECWLAGLKRKGWVTPGYTALLASKNIGKIPSSLMPSGHRLVYIAGFYGLDGIQELLFRKLWQNGATICFHTDAALAYGKSEAYGTELHEQWLKKWHATAELAEESAPSEPQFRFFQAYDLHSQLNELSGILKSPLPGSTAIILNDPAALVPVLYETQPHEINVSIGYPLKRTQVYQFIKNLFHLIINPSEKGAYHWKELLKFYSQPFLQSLWLDSQAAGSPNPFASFFTCLRNGSQYIDWDNFLTTIRPFLPGDFLQFISNIFKISVKNFSAALTTRQLAESLAILLDFMLSHKREKNEADQMEAEAITRIKSRIIPILQENALADEQLGSELLETVFINLTNEERIPFAADSLGGIQLLGLLETRLLQFDNVIMLDTNDDLLPGGASQDPLLPDSLRSLLGLPDKRRAELIAEHNFFRLCASAKNVKLLWQEGSTKSELFDQKKLRSRFIEQTIWELEKKKRALVNKDSNFYNRATASLSIRPEKQKVLKRNAAINKKLRQHLRGHLSPTILDAYYRCPLSFARENLQRLRTPPEVQEGDNPAWVGTTIHLALKNYYEQFIGKTISKNSDEISAQHAKLMEIFRKIIADDPEFDRLPVDSALMLELGAKNKFYKMLSQQPEKTEIYKLEWKSDIPLTLAGEKFNCKIIIDRIDIRDDKHFLLDYKTYKLKDFDSALWKDAEFFSRLEDAISNRIWNHEQNEELFLSLRKKLPSIQLPFYLTALRANPDLNPAGAAYVDLYSTGKEKPLFSALTEEELEKTLDYCQICVNFVAHNLFYAPFFQGNGELCSWCPTAPLCAKEHE